MDGTKKPGPVRVSVVTPTRDRARYLGDAIRSALDQGFPGLEVIVVDDGSTDGTPAVAASFGDRIRYERRGTGSGPGAARNRALGMARGEYVAFLDSDDLWRPGRLARQIPMLDAAPRAGLLYAAVDYVDADGNPSPIRRSRRGTPSGRILRTLLRHNVMETSTVIARRALVEEAGGFDPRFRWNEDLDLWLRIALRHEVIYDPTPSVLMRRHPDQLIARHRELGDSLVEVLEGNLERLRRDAPEWVPAAAKALGAIRLRRADRRFREGEPDRAREEIARAVALAPSLRLRAAAIRLRAKVRRPRRPRTP
jgi:glycosyltransferase involved in cell wall biosynthesis